MLRNLDSQGIVNVETYRQACGLGSDDRIGEDLPCLALDEVFHEEPAVKFGPPLPSYLLSRDIPLVIDFNVEVTDRSLVPCLNDHAFGRVLRLFTNKVLESLPLVYDEGIVFAVVIDLLLGFGLGHLDLSAGKSLGHLSELFVSAPVAQAEHSGLAKVTKFRGEILHRFVLVVKAGRSAVRFVQIDPSSDQAEKVHIADQVSENSRFDLGEVGRDDYPALGCLQASLGRGAFDFISRYAVKVDPARPRKSFRMGCSAIE